MRADRTYEATQLTQLKPTLRARRRRFRFVAIWTLAITYAAITSIDDVIHATPKSRPDWVGLFESVLMAGAAWLLTRGRK